MCLVALSSTAGTKVGSQAEEFLVVVVEEQVVVLVEEEGLVEEEEDLVVEEEVVGVINLSLYENWQHMH